LIFLGLDTAFQSRITNQIPKKMKQFFTLLLSFSVLQLSVAQANDFFFNIHQPSSIFASYQPGQFMTTATGWGWDGTIGTPVIGEMVYAPEDAGTGMHSLCDDTNVPDFTGKIVLIERGSCEFGLKALIAQNNGAIGVVIHNFDESLITMGAGANGANVTIPTIMVPLSLGQSFIDELNNGQTVVASFANAPINLAKVDGKVTFDENNDCVAQPGELSLGGWQIKATMGNFSRYAYSKADGTYNLYVELGTSIISVSPPANYWLPCGNDFPVTFTQYDSTELGFVIKALQSCPQMNVDIESPFTRRCFDNYYDLDYCNLGSAIAQDASITVQFAPLFEIMSSSMPYTDLGNNLIEFQVGDIGIGQCGHIDITAYLSCDATLGETYCVIAEAQPFDPCPLPGSTWSGADIRVTGECVPNDVVHFEIKNIGAGDMTGPLNYTILKNGQFMETASFQLAAGGTMNFGLGADGSTYRMETGQEPNHPNLTNPAATVEGCSQNGTFSTGFFNMFPQADYGNGYDEECNTVIGSFDPNDKTGFPLGYGPKHYIERGMDLQYLIRFQNTGTDTAFTVVVRDTITNMLDISTLRLGVSSHPFELKIVNGSILEFMFKDILLPDSFVNEPSSHGYLNFSISQKPNLALGSIIENSAGIYFDFNAPVITNVTFHEIGENFINSASTAVFRPGLEVAVSPNPMRSTVKFDLGEARFKTGIIELFDSTGRRLREVSFDSPSFILERKGLASGNIFYKISLDGQLSASGKLMVK
jgi:hypothetical protein